MMTTRDNYSLRYGIWRSDKAASRGTVILLSGRTEFMEKYAEIISDLQQRGFDVYSFDWRGQGLSARMLSNRHKGFVKTYDDYIGDLALFVDKIVKPQSEIPLGRHRPRLNRLTRWNPPKEVRKVEFHWASI